MRTLGIKNYCALVRFGSSFWIIVRGVARRLGDGLSFIRHIKILPALLIGLMRPSAVGILPHLLRYPRQRSVDKICRGTGKITTYGISSKQ
jgi:hypothetical protein